LKALVHVAALQPEGGETSAVATPPKGQATNALSVSKDGFISLEQARSFTIEK
jgi:hypothetical protein